MVQAIQVLHAAGLLQIEHLNIEQRTKRDGLHGPVACVVVGQIDNTLTADIERPLITPQPVDGISEYL